MSSHCSQDESYESSIVQRMNHILTTTSHRMYYLTPICPHPSPHSTVELNILSNSISTDLSSEFLERTKFCQDVRLIAYSLCLEYPLLVSTRYILLHWTTVS